MFRRTVSAMRCCRQRNVVHRDLSPENVLLDAELSVKITGSGRNQKCTGLKPSMLWGNFSHVARSASWATTVRALEATCGAWGAALQDAHGAVPSAGRCFCLCGGGCSEGTATCPLSCPTSAW